MNSERIKILREIQQAHELVHIMAFDTICETAGWAADEIERLRAQAPNQHGWAVLSSPNVIVVYPWTVARPPGSALVRYRFDQEDPPLGQRGE